MTRVSTEKVSINERGLDSSRKLGVISSVVACSCVAREAARSEGAAMRSTMPKMQRHSVKQDIRDYGTKCAPPWRSCARWVGDMKRRLLRRGEQRYQQGAGKHHLKMDGTKRTCGSCEHSEAAYRVVMAVRR